ncbi:MULTISPECIES: metallophosphoesterase family protein [Brucella]|uniref:metallophosphoesterase family protein n=1 Tax=Brucella TaxID=234 RepID=UPI0015F94BC8|nr:metallophosphoesterase family protein [Brucella anthropi]QTN02100.1 metallophosphoesterase [Ochrobactrum sp. EEELCW01]MBA8859358.1 putative phosphoesterase [Brucella anthropi]MDG9791284.1 metallophosphatase family protein [Brucella anthropi]MDH0580880.1 metallophosphatase family protein [Brucella anthropi]MDH0817833.1 metallophosphatase family protein [Brucella anthropi]
MPFERFAVISDIHGNSDALAAVLADIDALQIQTIINLGDHLSGPLAARETADMLMAREMICIRGNHDRWLVEKPLADMGPSDRVAREQLDDRHIEWLLAMPASQSLADGRIFICHGTPSSDTTYWMEKVIANGEVVLRTRDEIEAEAEDIAASLIFCGHTHTPRIVRLGDGRMLVNPGSVGCPGYDDDHPVPHVVQTGNPNASYAVIEQTGSGRQITLRNIPYDTARMVRMAENNGRADWARVVRSGWFQPT